RALGVDYQKIRVIHGQTDLIDHGIGAHAARATGLTGGAVHETALLVRNKALAVAGQMMQTPAEDLEIVEGVVKRRGEEGGPSLEIGDIARHLASSDPDG